MRWLDGITDTMDMSLGRPWVLVLDREAWRAVAHGGLTGQMHIPRFSKSSHSWLVN